MINSLPHNHSIKRDVTRTKREYLCWYRFVKKKKKKEGYLGSNSLEYHQREPAHYSSSMKRTLTIADLQRIVE